MVLSCVINLIELLHIPYHPLRSAHFRHDLYRLGVLPVLMVRKKRQPQRQPFSCAGAVIDDLVDAAGIAY